MTIASALAAAQGRVADVYTAISNKGGTLPATQNLANMPTAINSISGLIGETRTEQLDSTSGNTYTPSTGYNGITSITVTPKNYNRTVTAQTVPSTWAVPSGYSGHGNISVNAVTSSIDANIQAGNIKSGVTILGVTGTYGGGGETIDEWAERVLTGDTVFSTATYNSLGQTATQVRGWSDTTLTDIDLPNVELLAVTFSMGTTALQSVSVPKLKIALTQILSYYQSGYYTQITELDFPELIFSYGVCRNITGLVKLLLPKLIQSAGGFASECPNLEYIYAPAYKNTSGNSYGLLTSGSNPKITTVYLRDIEKIESTLLYYSSHPDFDTLVLAGNHIVTLSAAGNINNQTYYPKFYNGTGSIYVPDALVSSYQAATNWSTMASMIKPLSTWTNPYA